MAFILLVVNGMVLTAVGPFKSRKEAEAWREAEGIKTAITVPIIYHGSEYSEQPSSERGFSGSLS